MEMNARRFLNEWYIDRGINPDDFKDLKIKRPILKANVRMLNYPSGKEPVIYELERQLLKENGYCV